MVPQQRIRIVKMFSRRTGDCGPFKLHRVFHFVLTGLFVAPSTSCGDEVPINDIRSQSYFHVGAIRTLQLDFEIDSSDGWRSKASFIADGNLFRVDRQDISGMPIDGRQTPAASFAAAFDGTRYQLRHDSESILRLEDGNANARYTIDTPQITLYGWLASPGQQLRWDSIRDGTLWTQRFKQGTYAGQIKEGERTFQTVEFPQREGVKTPCIFTVFFADDLHLFPLKWIRRVESTQEVAAVVEVTKYVALERDGVSIVFPLQLRTEITGADKVTRPRTSTISVDENTVKVNSDVDAAKFNIPLPIYDIDQMNRHGMDRARVEQDRNSLESSGDGSLFKKSFLVANICAVLFIVAFVVIRQIRRRYS